MDKWKIERIDRTRWPRPQKLPRFGIFDTLAR